uniref:CSON004992 protein n=1 Tax=Culicoides sonorensis TaxID=179676 RepID=A0A336MW08_CULSO
MTSVCERIGFKSDALLNNVSSGTIDPKQMGYIWVPPGLLTSTKIQQYFNQLPSEKVPKLNSSGEKYRNKMLLYQLPKQDLALAYCKYVDKEHNGSFEDFIAARNEIALDIGYVKDAPQKASCNRCTKSMQQSELAVFAPKLRDNMTFHPNCFTCTTCDELLVDLTYCVYEDKIYCERHYSEILKPRCSSCDEELKVSEGPCLNPDAVLTIEDDLLLSCAKREISIMECIHLKRAEGTGNLELFEKLNEKFPQKNSSVENIP